MRVRDLVAETYSALDANRARSALTILGIVIGIGAVIAMTTIIGGIQVALSQQMGLTQARLISIGWYYDSRPLTEEDLEKIVRDIPEFEFLTGYSYSSGKVTTGEKKADATLIGCEPKYFEAMDITLDKGRAFNDSEEEKNAQVIVIDRPSVRVLFDNADADVVGKRIRVGNDEYVIVGVMEGSEFGMSESVTGYIPFSTMVTRVSGRGTIDNIIGFAREDVDPEELAQKTEEYLKTTYGISEEQEGSIYVESMKKYIDMASGYVSAFTILMTSVASISLLVGGIGIMNMMLTNVTERIREIGLRKALGARRTDITMQFILEAVTLCLAGGFLGILLGLGGAYALADVASDAILSDGTKIMPVIDLETIIMTTVVCTAIGLLFGWYPARRAAKLDPVESLHYQ